MAQAIIRTIGYGGEGHDYTSIATWEAASQAPRSVINVAVVFPSIDLRGGYPTEEQALDSLIRWSSQETSDFLLIHASGEIIAWKRGSEIYRKTADMEAMFIKNRDLSLCLFLVDAFLHKFFREPLPDDLPDIIAGELKSLSDLVTFDDEELSVKQLGKTFGTDASLFSKLRSLIPEEKFTLLMMLLVSIAVGLNTCFGNNISRIKFEDDAKEFLERLVEPKSDQDTSKRHRDDQERRGSVDGGVAEI